MARQQNREAVVCAGSLEVVYQSSGMHGGRSRAQHAQQRVARENATASASACRAQYSAAQRSAALLAWASSFRAAGRLRSLLSNGGHLGSGQASHGRQQGGACKGEAGMKQLGWPSYWHERCSYPPTSVVRAGSCT